MNNLCEEIPLRLQKALRLKVIFMLNILNLHGQVQHNYTCLNFKLIHRTTHKGKKLLELSGQTVLLLAELTSFHHDGKIVTLLRSEKFLANILLKLDFYYVYCSLLTLFSTSFSISHFTV